jgi:sarcosine oxidase subunit alpha
MTRLAPITGEWIDRARQLDFQFEGKPYRGFAGDTITSALWASGVRVLGRSFKYHRSRGVLSLANHDVNAVVDDGRSLNVRADVTALAAGMQLAPVNVFGTLERDRAQMLDRFSRFLPVGFYYKAFFRPKWTFPHWERAIRKLSGLGKPDFDAPRVRTRNRHAFCDVLVIGAGPSGMAAALAAGRAGAKVMLVDENARIGGSLTYAHGADPASHGRLQRLTLEIEQCAAIRVIPATYACGFYTDRWVALVDSHRMTKVRARSVIVATGVMEQPAVFRHNDLPGVMLASAAQRLIYRYAVRPLENAVLLTANTEGYAAALDLSTAGVKITAIVDLRAAFEESQVGRAAAARGIRVMQRSCIYEAIPTPDRAGVSAVSVCRMTADGRAEIPSRMEIPCDGVVMSVGFAAANGLLHQAGATMVFDERIQQFVPDALPSAVFAAGRVNGFYDLELRLRDGERAAAQALQQVGIRWSGPDEPTKPPSRCPTFAYPIIAHRHGKNFVDFDEDLMVRDFTGAAQEGFDSSELLKRYTTVGMGPSQGKHSNMNALRILARVRGQSIGDLGATTARPFIHPVPLSHLAGRGFTPVRLTPLHGRHERAGAVFMHAGVWLRPEYYASPGKSKSALVTDEVLAVRHAAGLIDVGTLGKIEVSGPDAGELLERAYTGRYQNLKVGMTRYAVMLDESGVIIDDGVVARFGEQRYYFTTTTTNSAVVYRELQRCIAQWRLDCGIVNLTGAMAAMNLAGPRSREILSRVSRMALDDFAFPYLGAREGTIAGAPARVLRVGFVGELGFEIHVPAEYAAQMWDDLIAAGADAGLVPFGVEAQRLLRLEKGHIIVGQDTDGLTTPLEAALEWALRMEKPFFVGQRSLRAMQARPLKQRLAGFVLPTAYSGPSPSECHLVIREGKIAGRVTSVAYSPTLKQIVGLAMLTPELSAVGTHFQIRVAGGTMLEAEAVALPFYDPRGERQRPTLAQLHARKRSQESV